MAGDANQRDTEEVAATSTSPLGGNNLGHGETFA